jgi:hypothetical protein
MTDFVEARPVEQILALPGRRMDVIYSPWRIKLKQAFENRKKKVCQPL